MSKSLLSYGVTLILWQNYVCRELVAHQHLYHRGKLRLTKQIRCHCTENAIFHLYPPLISKGEEGIFKKGIKCKNKCEEWVAEEGMCVSRVLGGLWNKNYICFPCRVDGGHGCVCVWGGGGGGGDSRALVAHSLDVTYCIGSVCGRWGLSGWRDNTHCPARSLGRHRKYGSQQIRLTVTWLWRPLVLASWLAVREASCVITLGSRRGAPSVLKNAYWFFLFFHIVP